MILKSINSELTFVLSITMHLNAYLNNYKHSRLLMIFFTKHHVHITLGNIGPQKPKIDTLLKPTSRYIIVGNPSLFHLN